MSFDGNRDLDAQLLQPGLHLFLDHVAQVDFGQAHVAVRVALDVSQHREVLGLEREHQPFREHGHAVLPAVAQTLDDGADQRVDDLPQAHVAPNSSGISVSVAPAALPMPSARWPALRPIATTKYHRDVVLASTIRFCTICTPTCRAVW